MNGPDLKNTMANPRWERRKEARPAEIISAAMDLFVEKGFAAARLDEIAVRAGVSKGTLYLYFPSKEAMFKAVVRETIVPMLQEFADALSQSEKTASQQLSQFFSEWWTKFGCTRMSGICKVVISEAGNFPEMAQFFQHEVIEPNHLLLKKIIDRGILNGEFRPMDVDSACHLVMAPLVLQAVWQHSFALCEPCQVVPPVNLIETHKDNILRAFSALSPNPANPNANTNANNTAPSSSAAASLPSIASGAKC